MKTGKFVGMFAFLFCLAQIAAGEPPAVPPDSLPSIPREMLDPVDVCGNDILGRVDQMTTAGDAAGALFLLRENFEKLSRLRGMLFERMLGALLMQDNVEEARQIYLQYAKYDQDVARAGIEQVYNYYLKKGDTGTVIEWTKQLLGLPLPDDLKPKVFGWHFSAVCSRGITAEARGLIKDCIRQFNAEDSRTVLEPVVISAIGGGKYADASQLLDLIEKEGKNVAGLRSMIGLERAKVMFSQKQWDKGEAFVIKVATDLSDDDLAALLSFAASKAQKDEEYAVVDRLDMFVLKTQKDKIRARSEAATTSISMLKMGNKSADIPARFEQLMQMGIPTADLYTLYSDNIYPVILQENNEVTKQMLAFGGKLKDRLANADNKKQMTLLLVDGSFVMGDYERALQLVDANADYWQKDWVESTKAKIKAHQDLQNKNYREAVGNFRKYMDYVARNDVGVYNQKNDQLYTPNMLLGFNALRIGDILREHLKDETGARAAYDEAEDYFKKALVNLRPDSKESKYVQDQLAQIASRKKK